MKIRLCMDSCREIIERRFDMRVWKAELPVSRKIYLAKRRKEWEIVCYGGIYLAAQKQLKNLCTIIFETVGAFHCLLGI